jgi:Cu/Ag efflux protein CusF
MKMSSHLILTLLLLGCTAVLTPGCSKDKPADSNSSAATAEIRHPLKGVITDVYADQSSLMVKHENIPGFMMAMTMMFKVDAATLKAAQKGQTITGTLVQRGQEFWLEDVKNVETHKRNSL